MSETVPTVHDARAALLAGRFDEAVAAYQALLALTPQSNELYLELSSALAGQGRIDEANVIVTQLLPLTQGALHDEVLLQLATFRIRQKRNDEAAALLSPLVESSVGERAALALSGVWNAMGFPARASALVRRTPGLTARAEGLQNLVVALSDQAKGSEVLPWVEHACDAGLLTPYLLSNALMTLTYLDDCEALSARLRAKVARVFDGARAPRPGATVAEPHVGSLRVGMVSADLNRHPVGYFLDSFLYELVRHCWVALYYNGTEHDAVTAELGRAAHRMTTVSSMSDEALVDLVRSDRIDLLIDLSGHTGHHRLGAFARRAAKVQVSFLGYFASTGLAQMDAVIMDRVHVDEDDREQFSEKVYRLPCSRFCYRPPDFAVTVGPLPAQRNGRITFGSFSNTAKMSPRCIDVWAAVLKSVAASRLQLRWKTFRDREVRRTIWDMFRTRGIAQDRIELYPESAHDEMFEHYQELDIALDTMPFSGATTSCEALWSGVPVVTRRGSSAVSRQTASILGEIGLGRLVAGSDEQFVATACGLAGDTPALAALRGELRSMMAATCLMDAKRYASHLARLLYAIADDFA